MAWRLVNVTRGTDLTEFARPVSAVQYTHQAYAETSRLAGRIDDEAGALTIEAEDEVYLTDDGVKVFAGYVRQCVRTDAGTSGQRIYSLVCQDYTTLLSDDIVETPTVLPAGQSDLQWITTLFSLYGQRGVVIGPDVQQLRASMPADLDAYGLTLHQCLTEIAKVTGGSFYVDFDKRLHYFDSEAESAPFGLSDDPNGSTTFGYEDFTIPDDSVDYRNAVLVIGTDVAVWRYRGGSPPAAGQRRAAVIRDPEIITTAAADARGDAFLAGAGDVRQAGSLTTYKPGLRGGMNVQITHSGWGISAVTYRVTAVEAHPASATRTKYTVRFGGRPSSLADMIGVGGTIASTVARHIEQVNVAIADLSAAGANMVVNSSFEDGTAWNVGPGWVIGHVPVAPQEPFFGSKVARVSVVGVGSTHLYQVVPIARSDDWWVSWWYFVRSVGGGSGINLYVHQAKADGTLLTTDYAANAVGVDAEWKRAALHFAPAPGSGAIAWHAEATHVWVVAQAVGTIVVDVDGVQVERGKLLTAYAPRPYELVDGSITGGKLADLAITETKIAPDAISTPKLQANSIDATKLQAQSVITDKLATNAVVAGKVATSAITADKIDVAAVTANKIAAGAVATSKLAVADGLGGNLCANGSFQNGVPASPTSQFGWTSAPSLDTTTGLSDAQSLQGAVTGPNVEAGYGMAEMPLLANRWVTISGYARNPIGSGSPTGVMYLLTRRTGTGIGGFDYIHGPINIDVGDSATWTRFVGTYLMPSDVVAGYVRIGMQSNPGVGPTFVSWVVWEDVQVEYGEAATAYKPSLNPNSSVIIDSSGVTIREGKLQVINPSGTVIIDGTSNMFKIAATGLLTTASLAAAGISQAAVTISTGLPYRPAHAGFQLDEGGATDETLELPYYFWDPAGTGVISSSRHLSVTDPTSSTTTVTANTKSRSSEVAMNYRYYLYKEVAL